MVLIGPMAIPCSRPHYIILRPTRPTRTAVRHRHVRSPKTVDSAANPRWERVFGVRALVLDLPRGPLTRSWPFLAVALQRTLDPRLRTLVQLSARLLRSRC